MIKILIIEGLFSAIIGAVLFRLSFWSTKSTGMSWAVVAIVVAAVMVFLPGDIDEYLISEYSGAPPPARDLSPFLVNLLRSLSLIAGAGLAAVIIAKRKRIGLEDDRPFKNFP